VVCKHILAVGILNAKRRGATARRLDERYRHELMDDEERLQLRERLYIRGRGTSTRKQAQAVGAALLKGVGDVARGFATCANSYSPTFGEHEFSEVRIQDPA
jgi:hypothetical protein